MASLSYEAFERRFSPLMLLFVTESWAIRKEQPSSLALALDAQHIRSKAMLRQMFDSLTPKETTDAPAQRPSASKGSAGTAPRPASPGQAGPNPVHTQPR